MTLHAICPVLDLALCLVLRDAVTLLDPANELVLLAVDQCQIVVRQLTPLLLHFTGDLFPVAFNAIPIHGALLSGPGCERLQCPKQRRGVAAVAAVLRRT